MLTWVLCTFISQKRGPNFYDSMNEYYNMIVEYFLGFYRSILASTDSFLPSTDSPLLAFMLLEPSSYHQNTHLWKMFIFDNFILFHSILFEIYDFETEDIY